MQKFYLFLSLALLCIILGVGITWTNRENILAHFLSRQLHVPVSMRSLDMGMRSAEIGRLWIGNPKDSQTTTSFTAERLACVAALDQIFGKTVTLEKIDIDNVFVGIEFYNPSGEDNNWSRILQANPKKRKTSKEYLIRTLNVQNLTVEFIQANGKIKRYPTIKQIEFHNINRETGFPVDEIEKAIFDLIMKDLFKKLQLNPIISCFMSFNNEIDYHFLI